MKKYFFRLTALAVLSIIATAFISGQQVSEKPIYLNTSYSFEERAADLVSRMTLEEKQSQLGNTMPPIPRLGVNKYDVWGEALHGVMGRNNNAGMTATSFPNSVAMGSTWDPDLVKKETKVISDEARGFNHDLIFTLTYWSPVVEPTRDPRWGRTAETFAEDPFLVSKISSGFIKGLMGNDPTYLKTVPTGKHFIANNTEFNRHTGSSDMDDRDMREYYLKPYRALITKDALPSIMTAYGAVNGTPVSNNGLLVDEIARRTYGMDGYVTGDCGAIGDMYNGHNYAKDGVEATAMGLKTGVDSDCGGEYQRHAITALEQGLITESDINRALINMFTIRMRLGEFDPPSIVPYAGIKPSIVNDPSHNDLAILTAVMSPVLLKNELSKTTNTKALPFDPLIIKKIAILGPQADKIELGDYSGPVEDSIKTTPQEGLKQYIAENNLDLEVVLAGSGNTERRNDFFTPTRFTTISSDGDDQEYDATDYMESAPGLIIANRFGRTSIRGIKDGDWTAYGNIDVTKLDSIRFNFTVATNGGSVDVRVGSSTGNIIASSKVESTQQGGGFFGRQATITAKVNTLGITGAQDLYFVYREPETPATDKATLDIAQSADVAIIFVGTDQNTGREESDRFSLKLPGNQEELINAVAKVNPNTIVVMQTMGMVEVEGFKNNPNIPGIIFTGYNGQAQGYAMAKILFGDVNPGGKTPLTWYKSVEDLPDFNDYSLRKSPENDGRTYWYFDGDVSYEFGFGLSYTTFDYSNFAINKKSITPNGTVTVSVDVSNTGEVDGDEVVQVYVKTPESPATLQRPIKRLKGFQRVTIPAGQTKTVDIEIDGSDLWFWDSENDKITFDQGKYIFEIGASSRDIKGEVTATMSGEYQSVLRTVVAEAETIVMEPGYKTSTSLTASLTDDSFIDLAKAQVTYKSNDQRVATVDSDGQVTAHNPGVANIIATVSYNGSTAKGSYPIKVMPNLTPKTIEVSGKTIQGFNADNRSYSYLLDKSGKAPQVTATAVDKNIAVDIEQAQGVPGTAVIHFVDYNTFEKNTYYVHFDEKSKSDEFNGSLGSQWSWVRENSAKHSMSKNSGALTITSEVGDISEGSNNAKNLLLQSANNDWAIETKLVASRTPTQPENAGILAYQDDANFVKLMFRAVIKTTRQQGIQPGTIDLLVEENDIARSAARFELSEEVIGTNDLELKLEKKGSIYTAYYSTDGKEFKQLGSADILLKDIKAGLIVNDGIITQSMTSTFWFDSSTNKPDAPFNVSFDYFRIENYGLK
tara:strand:+ start:53808 stop:57614 length:3807 start_codon:yes stop_codon:yes gene_type:complete